MELKTDARRVVKQVEVNEEIVVLTLTRDEAQDLRNIIGASATGDTDTPKVWKDLYLALIGVTSNRAGDVVWRDKNGNEPVRIHPVRIG